MAVTFDLPADIEEQLRRDFADFDVAAKKVALISCIVRINSLNPS